MNTRTKRKTTPRSSPPQSWEDGWLQTCEKKAVEEKLGQMILPKKIENLDLKTMASICENLCLHLKIKYAGFEMFLMNPAKKKCNKYKSLEKLVFRYIKCQQVQPPHPSASTEAATTFEIG